MQRENFQNACYEVDKAQLFPFKKLCLTLQADKSQLFVYLTKKPLWENFRFCKSGYERLYNNPF